MYLIVSSRSRQIFKLWRQSSFIFIHALAGFYVVQCFLFFCVTMRYTQTHRVRGKRRQRGKKKLKCMYNKMMLFIAIQRVRCYCYWIKDQEHGSIVCLLSWVRSKLTRSVLILNSFSFVWICLLSYFSFRWPFQVHSNNGTNGWVHYFTVLCVYNILFFSHSPTQGVFLCVCMRGRRSK